MLMKIFYFALLKSQLQVCHVQVWIEWESWSTPGSFLPFSWGTLVFKSCTKCIEILNEEWNSVLFVVRHININYCTII